IRKVDAIEVKETASPPTVRTYDFSSVVERIDACAEKSPDAIAIVDGEIRMTYAQLAARSDSLALYLKSHGLGADQRVGLCMERSSELVSSVLGILKAGAAYVPLDPSYPANRLATVIDQAEVLCVMADQRSLRCLPYLPSHCRLVVTSEIEN